jgi:hypothetical protein
MNMIEAEECECCEDKGGAQIVGMFVPTIRGLIYIPFKSRWPTVSHLRQQFKKAGLNIHEIIESLELYFSERPQFYRYR